MKHGRLPRVKKSGRLVISEEIGTCRKKNRHPARHRFTRPNRAVARRHRWHQARRKAA